MLNKSFRFMIEYAYFGYYVCFLHVVNCAVIHIYFFFSFFLCVCCQCGICMARVDI